MIPIVARDKATAISLAQKYLAKKRGIADFTKAFPLPLEAQCMCGFKKDAFVYTVKSSVRRVAITLIICRNCPSTKVN